MAAAASIPASTVRWHGPKVGSWAAFTRIVKRPDRRLLSQLDRFERPILVAGCQRSGTTAITRLIAAADGMSDYRFGADDELDAALILAGQVSVPVEGRCCFQTTYLNDRYEEYFEHDDFTLVWVLREPLSVVYSMLNNWRRSALERLYEACGKQAIGQLGGISRPGRPGLFGPSRLEKACACYVSKVSQTARLAQRLHPQRMIVLDYDELIPNRERVLPRLFEFLGLPYRQRYADALHSRSVNKGRRFAPERAARIEDACLPVYEHARQWCIGKDARHE